MSRSGFMIYGAYGYTGRLITQLAVRRGHRPLLAGRRPEPLSMLAREHSLPSVTLSLDDPELLKHELRRVRCVVHAAGPFVHTSKPMIDACLGSGTHYVDITGELPAFEYAFSQHDTAWRERLALIPGLGFDVVPTDSLACFVAEGLRHATRLEIAFAVLGGASGGTIKASLEGLARGNFERRDGVLEPIPLGTGRSEVRFFDRARSVMPVPWGDLVTAFHSTSIPNIRTCLAIPEAVAKLLGATEPLTLKLAPGLVRLLDKPALKAAISSIVEANLKGPGDRERESGSTQLWARAADNDGNDAEAWLETGDAYAFTAESVVRGVERLLQRPLAGTLTPSQAFGVDFVLEIPGTKRHTRLPS
jgi:short subunit dehydrogenase-like uncharacterized protein